MKCLICNSYMPIISFRNIADKIAVYERYCNKCDKYRTYYENDYCTYNGHLIYLCEPNHLRGPGVIAKRFEREITFRIQIVKVIIQYLINKTGCPCCVCVSSGSR